MREYNICEVITMETELYDEEIEEIPNETTLRAMAQADRILDAWERMREEG